VDLVERVARLESRVRRCEGPLVLAGSSMGAFISAEVAARLEDADAATNGVLLRGLFLMAPPVRMPGWWPTPLRVPTELPLMVLHGWDDELIPASDVIDWCAPRRAELRLVDDTHRLAAHVDYSAQCFADLLRKLSP